jgi:hypothetical protein
VTVASDRSTVGGNDLLRFGLELAALGALAHWGWTGVAGFAGVLAAVGLPVLAAVLWGTFRAPDDASAGGGAPVPVPGPVRLALELGLFGLAVAALVDAGAPLAGLVLAALVVCHYLLARDRVRWLLVGGE